MDELDELRIGLDELERETVWENELYGQDLHDTISHIKKLHTTLARALNVLAEMRGPGRGAASAVSTASPSPPVGPLVCCDGVKECALAHPERCKHAVPHAHGPECGPGDQRQRCSCTPPPGGVCR